MDFKKQRILLTGASGYVGSKIYTSLKKAGYPVTGLYNNTKLFDDLLKVDIKSEKEVGNLFEVLRPDIIIHAAADAHTSTCEKSPTDAYDLNVKATKQLSDLAKTYKTRFIYISTFACFNQNPDTVYAKTKVEAENIVKQLENYVILRFSLASGLSPNTESKNFYNDLISAYKQKSPFEADSSWKFETTYLGHAAEVIENIINNPNINNEMIPVIEHGTTSKYEMAKVLLANSGINVKEIDSHKYIPPIEIDESIYKKYGLKKHYLKDSLEIMKQEFATL